MFIRGLIKNKKQSGFTLVELMVASSIFVIIMLIVSGSIVSVMDANHKSKNLRSVMDNLDLALESMTRTIRFGNNYHCGSTGVLVLPQDCPGRDTYLALTSYSGSQVIYSLSGSKIVRSIDGVSDDLTSPDITITNLGFWVVGSAPYVNGAGANCGNTDCFQPKVIIAISGYVGDKVTTRSSFSLQTTVSQRDFDFK